MRKIFLATKFALKGTPDGGRVFRNDPEYIRQAIDLSLERLGIDCVDLWYWYVVGLPYLVDRKFLGKLSEV